MAPILPVLAAIRVRLGCDSRFCCGSVFDGGEGSGFLLMTRLPEMWWPVNRVVAVVKEEQTLRAARGIGSGKQRREWNCRAVMRFRNVGRAASHSGERPLSLRADVLDSSKVRGHVQQSASCQHTSPVKCNPESADLPSQTVCSGTTRRTPNHGDTELRDESQRAVGGLRQCRNLTSEPGRSVRGVRPVQSPYSPAALGSERSAADPESVPNENAAVTARRPFGCRSVPEVIGPV